MTLKDVPKKEGACEALAFWLVCAASVAVVLLDLFVWGP